MQKANGDGDRDGGNGDRLGFDGDKIAAVSDEPQHDDMTFEDLGDEFVDMPVVPRARLDAACVRQDAAEIANGAWARLSDGFTGCIMHRVSLHACNARNATHTPLYTQTLCACLDALLRGMAVLSLRRHRYDTRDRHPPITASPRKR